MELSLLALGLRFKYSAPTTNAFQKARRFFQKKRRQTPRESTIASMASDFVAVFTSFNAHLESEASKKDNIAARVKDVAATSRALTANLQRVQMCKSHAGSLSFIMCVQFREISSRRMLCMQKSNRFLRLLLHYLPIYPHRYNRVINVLRNLRLTCFDLLPVFNFSVWLSLAISGLPCVQPSVTSTQRNSATCGDFLLSIWWPRLRWCTFAAHDCCFP
jgi:hypothetical protein